MKSPKVVIVHDWLIGGGAELVVEQLHAMFPDAPIYTSYCSPEWRERLKDAKIHTSYLQPFPSLRKFMPVLRARWFSRLDLSKFDIVVSSTGAEAKAVKTRSDARHICYMHAPTHYYWSRYESYLRDPGFRALNWLARLGLRVLVGPMRRWDYKAAQNPDVIIANSSHTKTAIKEYYGRESVVVHPPVDVDYFKPTKEQKRKGFIITGRHVAYKRFDLAVEACSELNMPLSVTGSGPETEQLRSIAGPTVTFLGHLSKEDLRTHLQAAEAFLFPGEDDLGIAPLEALASGTPVIAYEAGGALDFVQPGVNGTFFFPQTLEALKRTITNFEPKKLKHEQILKSTLDFSQETFRRKMNKLIKDNS